VSIARWLRVGNTSGATAVWPERRFAPLLGMVAKPLGISQAFVDLLQQIAHAVLSSLGHIPGHEKLQSTRLLGVESLDGYAETGTHGGVRTPPRVQLKK
jgi:hypothetical protein